MTYYSKCQGWKEIWPVRKWGTCCGYDHSLCLLLERHARIYVHERRSPLFSVKRQGPANGDRCATRPKINWGGGSKAAKKQGRKERNKPTLKLRQEDKNALQNISPICIQRLAKRIERSLVFTVRVDILAEHSIRMSRTGYFPFNLSSSFR